MTNKNTDIEQELKAIKIIMGRVGFLSSIKTATSQITLTAEVTDGKHEDVDFDVVVKCASKDFDKINRRLGSMKNLSIQEIAENVIGIRRR